MAAIRPNYHPSSASEQINVTNNLDYTDTLCWYDEQSIDNIKFPSIFTYKKTSGWDENLNLKLKSVILNSSSGSIKNTSPNLPSSEGSFEATLQLQNNNPPTMDLYFSGNIQINYTYDIDNHSYGDVYINSINPSTFDCSSNNYGLNKQLNIDYSTYYDFDSGYEYSHMWIRATINWGKDGDGNLIYNGSTNSSDTLTLAVPSSYVSDIIPTITIWMQLYSKQSSEPEPEPGTSWTAKAVGNNATYDENTGNYVSFGASYNRNGEAYVDGVSGDSRHCSWEVWDDWYGIYEWITVSAWIPKEWIDPSDYPN